MDIISKQANVVENSLQTKQVALLKIAAALFIIIACFLMATYFVYIYLPVNVDWALNGPPQVGVDWKGAFRKACLELLNGRSPYNNSAFFNPPWTLLPLLPIALLSPALGSAVMYVLNLFVYLFAAWKLKINVWLTIPFMVFSGMLINSNNGNIEGIIALGFILPPQIGLFFILAKPQIGVAVAIFWLIESWRAGGAQKVLIVFLPVVLAYIFSFLVFGFWILNSFNVVDKWWNTSIWPRGIPIGVILLGLAIWKREIKFAIAASPFFAPYLTIHSWAFTWLGLLLLFPQQFRFSVVKDGFLNNLPWRCKS
jgi:hypothetical protein